MAQIDLLKRYLDAGMAFTQLTEKKAKAIVKDLVKTGEVQTGDVGKRVEELLDRSRKNTEVLLEVVRSEVQSQVSKLGLVPKKDLDKVKKELADLKAKQSKSPAPSSKASAAKKASPVRKTVKKAAAKKTAPAATGTPAPLPSPSPSPAPADASPETPGEL
jgi:polyhydroxyalkanoate synthesis regulator phasin